jgi:hypothetical protein
MIIEIPYKPDESCIIDSSNFTSYADIDAYEYIRLSKVKEEFSLYQDPDVLKQNMVYPINDEALGKQNKQTDRFANTNFSMIEFEYDFESLDQDSDLSNDLDFSSIPYSDHTFDIDHFIQCN